MTRWHDVRGQQAFLRMPLKQPPFQNASREQQLTMMAELEDIILSSDYMMVWLIYLLLTMATHPCLQCSQQGHIRWKIMSPPLHKLQLPIERPKTFLSSTRMPEIEVVLN